jgi:hypothetical protein
MSGLSKGVLWRGSERKQGQENEIGEDGRDLIVSHYMMLPGRQRRPMLRMCCKRTR